MRISISHHSSPRHQSHNTHTEQPSSQAAKMVKNVKNAVEVVGKRVSKRPKVQLPPPDEVEDEDEVEVEVDEERVSSPTPSGSSSTPKRVCKLSEEHEIHILDWMRDNPMLWDQKHLDFKNKAKRDRMWEDMARDLKLSTPVLRTGYKDLRDWNTKLQKPPKSGDGARTNTAREDIILQRFAFLKNTVRHRAAPVTTPTETKLRKGGDLEAAEKEAAECNRNLDEADDDATSATSTNPNKKKTKSTSAADAAAAENLAQILNQLSAKDQQIESIGSRINTIQAQVHADKDPTNKKKTFCDWVRSEILSTSEEEYLAYQSCFLHLHHTWLKERKSAQLVQQQQQPRQYNVPPYATSPAYPNQWQGNHKRWSGLESPVTPHSHRPNARTPRDTLNLSDPRKMTADEDTSFDMFDK